MEATTNLSEGSAAPLEATTETVSALYVQRREPPRGAHLGRLEEPGSIWSFQREPLACWYSQAAAWQERPVTILQL